MIAVISPAKTLDFETPVSVESTLSRLPGQTRRLIKELKTKKSADLQSLMDISENIANLNVQRNKAFRNKHTEENSRPSISAFKGDVYIGLEAETLTNEDIHFAQDHLRILSGLYGLLRPLDLIQPYRLEMGTSFHVDEHKSLYSYWEDRISKLINKDLRAQGDRILVNLASNEYFKSIDKKALKADIINVEFKDYKNGDYKVISFFAKKARGLMSRYMIKNRIDNPEDLKSFDYEGYYYDPKTSNETNLSFKRDQVNP